MASEMELVDYVARAMQASKAWPVVFQAGSAQELARIAINAVRSHEEFREHSRALESAHKPLFGP